MEVGDIIFAKLSSARAEETSVAIIHYSPDPKECAIIKKEQVGFVTFRPHGRLSPTLRRFTSATLAPSSWMVRPM
jgi:hypothetical protein